MRPTLLIAITAVAAALATAGGTKFISEAGANMTSSDVDRIAALEKDLAATKHRLRRAESYQEISNLQRIYGYYLDKALYGELVDLMTDDVSLEYSGRGVYVGKAHARELMKMMPGGKDGLKYGQLQNHMQLQGVVHVAEDGKTAKGRWRALIMMGDLNKSAQWQEATYENEYREEGGVWKISKIRAYVNLNAEYAEGWHKNPGIVPGVSKEFPPDRPPTDPSYKPYPAAYIPPYHYKNPVTGK
jgi:hypothetical protein